MEGSHVELLRIPSSLGDWECQTKKVYKIGTFLNELQIQRDNNSEYNQLLDEIVSTIVSELRMYGYNGYQIYEWFKQRINNVENLRLR
jgi:DNA-binding transcriptional regulator YhcF (GntR family)